MVEVVKLFRIIPVNAFRRHGVRAFLSKARPRVHAIQKQTVNSRRFKDFTHHGDGVVAIFRIIAHLAEETIQTILLVGAAVRVHDEPVAVAKPLFVGQAEIHVSRQFDTAAMACVRQFLQKIMRQRGMADADLRIVVGHA